MFHNTALLCKLYEEYEIAVLKRGKREDALGDAFEDYTIKIFNNEVLLEKAKNGTLDSSKSDEYVFDLFSKAIGDIADVSKFVAKKENNRRTNGSNPKTDVTVNVYKSSDPKSFYKIPISIKQTTAERVAMAEFDVDTIIKEMGISDETLKNLIEKHQTDGSAKNFSDPEKKELTNHLAPISKDFVRWVITGTPRIACPDEIYPDYILKYQLEKNGYANNQDHIKAINFYSTEEYVKIIMTKKNGTPRTGGFGTGLTWTYATGSKGKKIQFKG